MEITSHSLGKSVWCSRERANRRGRNRPRLGSCVERGLGHKYLAHVQNATIKTGKMTTEKLLGSVLFFVSSYVLNLKLYYLFIYIFISYIFFIISSRSALFGFEYFRNLFFGSLCLASSFTF
jgi:hypothetical protein